MFDKSILVTIDRKAANGPAATKVEERTLVQGVGDSLKALIDDDIAVGGVGATVTMVGAVYLAALGTNRALTGGWNFNPLSAG